ncbi:MAG: class I SAM-dependent methyltransferase, partial [Boseongicola sp. SB0675_bin_26]|nr:class I SAM-dependent methyltransferase [Boseongicola sp. SB0675_bin_26]
MSGQADPEAQEQNYTMGYNEEFQVLLRRRSAANSAAHLLPRLNSGMRLLDVGCGPGTISMGLADVVAPGQFIGVDIEESQVEMARAAASAGGHKNAEFQVADAVNLPFESNSFDVV